MIRATLEKLRLSEEEMGPLWRLLPGPERRLPRAAEGEGDVDADADGKGAGGDVAGGSGHAAGAGGAGRRLLRVCDTLLDGNGLRYLTECIESNWISSAGRFVGAFEERFAAAAGCAHGVACASGTAALHLALAALGIGPDDEVIVPTFTMIATANAVTY